MEQSIEPEFADANEIIQADQKEPERLICAIDLDFAIKSKSNFRRTKSAAHSKEWASQQGFENSLAVLALRARPRGWDMGEPGDKLSKRPGYVILIVARTTLDTANMAKSVTDALEGILFVNDASVRHVACVSERARTAQSATILVSPISASAPISEVLALAQWLGEKYAARAEAD